MAYTFLKAQGQEIGKSLLEADKVDLAKELLAEAKKRNVKLLLPVDHVVAMKPEANAVIQQVGEGEPFPPTRWRSISARRPLSCSRTKSPLLAPLFGTAPWVCSSSGILKGTFKVAHAVADNGGAISIVGGGDSVAAVRPRTWPTRSRTFPPAVERRWNFWKGRNCLASRP